MICPYNLEPVQNESLAMTPDQDHTYTPTSSQPSHQEFLSGWPTTSAASETDFSSLSSEPFSPDRHCGLGLFLPTFEFDETYHQIRASWQLEQSDVQYASLPAIAPSGLPIVEPKFLTKDPLYESYEPVSTSLPATPWHSQHTPFHGISHVLSPPCSNYSIPSRPSPMSSPFSHSEADFRSIGSPFIKIEPPGEDLLGQHDKTSTTEHSSLVGPWKTVKEGPDSFQERVQMFLAPSESTKTTCTKPPVPQPRRPRAFSSDDIRARTLGDRKKRTYTTQENAKLSCHVCGKLFQRKFNHRKHMETHQPTRVQPYTCEYEGCTKNFARRTDLARHEKSLHLQVRDYECPLCDASFARKDTLRRHVDDGCRLRSAVKKRT